MCIFMCVVGSINLVANVFFAYLWLRESLSARDVIGTFALVCGSTLSVIWVYTHMSGHMQLHSAAACTASIHTSAQHAYHVMLCVGQS